MSKPLTLVTAAAGKTGSAVVAELLSRGMPVRALVRREDARSRHLTSQGADVVVADMFDTESMVRALRGVQRAYYCPPMHPYTSAALAAFHHAATVNRLESVVALTQWLASPQHPTLLTRDMWAVEQLLPALENTAVTILNPGFFADNYLRVGLGMAAQLGLYANFVGRSLNPAPSNEDIARVAAAVLADPVPHAGRRYRITGPKLIGVDDITESLSVALGRKVRAIDAPEWLLNKVAAYRGEDRYSIAVFRHYLVDHRAGAFALGGPTDVVQEVTGAPAEDFAATVRRYASRPEARRSAGAFLAAFQEFLLSPLKRGYDNDAFEHQLGLPEIDGALYGMANERWKAERLTQVSPRNVTPLASVFA